MVLEAPWLYRTDFWIVYLLCLALVLGAVWLGARIGARMRAAGGQAQYGLHGLDSAILGLLALMIGFTFAIALSRFDARRDGLLAEANAIGTAWLRAGLLPEPYRDTNRALLREYVKIRLEVQTHRQTAASLADALRRSNAVQNELWASVTALAALQPQPVPTGLYLDSLNTMFDLQETRLAAARSHVPWVVFMLLIVVAVVACAFAGYSAGLGGNRRGLADFVTAALIVSVIMTIFDLDNPASGLIAVDPQPIRNVAASVGLEAR